MNLAGRENAEMGKDVVLTERTQCFITNKGLISRRCARTNAFLTPYERILKPKWAKNRLFLASRQGLKTEKTPPGEHHREARQASNSTFRRLETGGGQRLVAGAVRRKEGLEAIYNRASWLRGEMTVNCAFFPVIAICAVQECQTPHLMRGWLGIHRLTCRLTSLDSS